MTKMRDERGRFLPGQRVVGRQKGTSNKVTTEVREKFQQLVDSYSIEQMKADLMELEPVERLKIVTGLLDFFIPKLNRTDHTLQGDKDIIIVQLPSSVKTNITDDNRPDKPGLIQPDIPALTD
jgi:hypothetical protein